MREVTDRMEVLRRWSPFDGLDGEHLEWFARKVQMIRHPSGQVLMEPGLMPGQFYFIRQGTIRVEAMGRSRHNKVLAELAEGNCFPIEALHEERPVFSTYRAVDDVVTLELSEEDFRSFQEMSPEFKAFCEGRSATLLEQSRQLYRAQFAYNRSDRQSLDSPLSTIVSRDAPTCPPTARMRDVVQTLDESGSGTMVVLDDSGRPVGVYTLRGLVKDMSRGRYEDERSIREVMNRHPVILPFQALGYEAAMAMAGSGVHHVLVIDDHGKFYGILHEAQLFGLQRVGMAHIAESIQRCRDEKSLVAVAADIRQLAHNLIDQGVGVEQLTQLISTLNDQLTGRLIKNEINALALEGVHFDDLTFAWLAFGSEGRHEQTLSTDQDNGIVFIAPPGQGNDQVRDRLHPLALRINTVLDACGFTLCKGGIMASNAPCCLSLDEWKKRFSTWIDLPEPGALLNATIFFDFRPLFGAVALAHELREWLTHAAQDAKRLLALLVDNALERAPPLGLIRDFSTDAHGHIDLKLSGITLFVDCARRMALATGVADSSTRLRLRHGGAAKGVPATEVDGWLKAFHFVQLIRLRSQHEQHIRGDEITNLIDPYQLNAVDRKILVESLRQAGKLQKRVQAWLGAKAM
jgi:CBS domain-containing protein